MYLLQTSRKRKSEEPQDEHIDKRCKEEEDIEGMKQELALLKREREEWKKKEGDLLRRLALYEMVENENPLNG